MSTPQLYMLLLGCKPKGRHTEQHDVFFGIAPSVKELLPQVKAFWPEAAGKLHIDAWRTVTLVDGYQVDIVPAGAAAVTDARLFFINLGGYRRNEFEEFHYKMIVAAADLGAAVAMAKQTAFFKLTGFDKAPAHVDDKYGIDVDDVSEVEELLTTVDRSRYQLILRKADETAEADELQLGYFKLASFE